MQKNSPFSLSATVTKLVISQLLSQQIFLQMYTTRR